MAEETEKAIAKDQGITPAAGAKTGELTDQDLKGVAGGGGSVVLSKNPSEPSPNLLTAPWLSEQINNAAKIVVDP